MESSYHHGALRQALVEAAIELLSEGQDLSLRGVARRAGVSHAAPYHHFADRRALLAAVAQEGLATLRAALLAGAGRHEGEPRLQVLEVAVAYIRFALENRPRFRLIFSSELSERQGLTDLEDAYAAAYEVLTGMVRPLLGPDVGTEEVRFAALRAWSTVHGLANLLVENQVMGVRTIQDGEEIARRVLRKSIPAESAGR